MGLQKKHWRNHFTYAGGDTKTRFDVGEVVVGTYWLSGMGNLAKNVLTMMSAENDEQRFRYAVFQAALGLRSWSEESFPSIGLSSSFPLYPVMWLYKENLKVLRLEPIHQ